MTISPFQPTRSDRGWFINPVSDKNPWWLALAAALPAVLSVILIFLDQQITAVIVNRKENKLKVRLIPRTRLDVNAKWLYL